MNVTTFRVVVRRGDFPEGDFTWEILKPRRERAFTTAGRGFTTIEAARAAGEEALERLVEATAA
jgi:hypothetical protein